MFSDAKPTKLLLWEGYKMELHYNKKIQCSEGEFYTELSVSWKTINGLLMKESNAARGDKRPTDQAKVWKEFLDCHFVQIMLASSENTSLLEWGYTNLQMIVLKHRNRIQPENLKTLFLLATLNVPVKNNNFSFNLFFIKI